MHGLGNAKPDIEKTQSGDRAANKAQLPEVPDCRPVGQPVVVEPQNTPGQRYQNNPNLDAKDNVNNHKQALQPHRHFCIGFDWLRSGGRFEIEGSGFQDARLLQGLTTILRL